MEDEKGNNSQRVGMQFIGPVRARTIIGEINISGDPLFQPVLEAIRLGPAEKQPEAVSKLEALRQETAKGEHANPGVMRKLAEDIVNLAPDALKALADVFAKPVLSGVAGPVTQFLLKMLGQ